MTNPTINIDSSFSSNEGDAVNAAFGVGATPTNAARPNSQSLASPRGAIHWSNAKTKTAGMKEGNRQAMLDEYKALEAKYRSKLAQAVLERTGRVQNLKFARGQLEDLRAEQTRLKEKLDVTSTEAALIKAEEDLERAKEAYADAKDKFEDAMSVRLNDDLVVARDLVRSAEDAVAHSTKAVEVAEKELANTNEVIQSFLAGSSNN